MSQKKKNIAILVFGLKFEKLLGVPKVQQGTGKFEPEGAGTILQGWCLTEKIAAISFDKIAVNTGRINGACIGLEELLKNKLLWLACREVYILEVVFSEVFKKTFSGSKTGPDILLFKRFKTFWPKIRKEEFSKCNDVRIEQNLNPRVEETFCSNILQMKDKSKYF